VGLRASTVFFLGLAITLGAPSHATGTSASTSSSKADKYQVWRSQAVRALGSRADANSLATAAALSFTNHHAAPPVAPAAIQLVARAADLAPQSAAIGWLHLQLCAETLSCDTRDLATVLRWVDPDNGAAWLSELTSAHKDRDVVEVDRVLGDMARGTRFDLYYNQIVVLMFDALTAVRRELPRNVASSDLATFTALSGIASAEIIPPFSALIDACREAAPGTERREDCFKLAKIMQRGDTVIVQMVGFGIEKRFVAPDSKEGRSVAERRRLLEWRTSAAAKLDDSILPWTQNSRVRKRLAEMRLRPREEDVFIALLRDRKMALEPTENHP
jgi:hypothetical protein